MALTTESLTEFTSAAPLSAKSSDCDDTASEVLIRVESVSKVFCTNLKRSLLYGLKDSLSDINPFNAKSKNSEFEKLRQLRPGEFLASDDISFEVKRGECIGLIGHNGAGKTTLLKMLNGLIKPDHGKIEMRGRVGALIALGAGFNPILSGRENIYVNASILGFTKEEIDTSIDEIIDFAEIREFIDAPVQSYSSGMAVRLGFAIAVKMNPDILLLDEVLAVGDIGFQAKCFNVLADFKQRGVGFILVSHNMHMISRYADKLIYLSHGKIKYSGDPRSGIALFNQEMESTAVAGADGSGPNWDVVHGSGKIRLVSGNFRDENGAIVQEIRPNQSVELHIGYCRESDKPIEGVMDLVIRNGVDSLFQGTSRNYGERISFDRSSGVIVLKFSSIPSNSAELSFFIALFDSKNNELYDWKRDIRIRITPREGITGQLDLDISWCVS